MEKSLKPEKNKLLDDIKNAYLNQDKNNKKPLDKKILWIKIVIGVISAFVFHSAYSLLPSYSLLSKLFIIVIALFFVAWITWFNEIEIKKSWYGSSHPDNVGVINIFMLALLGYVLFTMDTFIINYPLFLFLVKLLVIFLIFMIMLNRSMTKSFWVPILIFSLPVMMIGSLSQCSRPNNIEKIDLSVKNSKNVVSSEKKLSTQSHTNNNANEITHQDKMINNIVENVVQNATLEHSTRRDICKYYFVSVKKLNIRNNPNKNAQVVGSLTQHKRVCIIKKQASWAYVQDQGWVSSKYLLREK